MKTIIISDIHNRVNWIEDALLSSLLQPYDKIICLGDYFDDFNDTIQDATNSAEWLKQSIQKPNRIHLTGTHDIWYRFPYNRFIAASGNTEKKASAINKILTQEDWNNLYLYHYEQNFLMSHAGVHINLISEYVYNHLDLFNKYFVNTELQLTAQEIIDKVIRPACEEALSRVQQGYSNSWLDAGIIRGGRQSVGGITWLDWIYEFKPIPGLNQIVGHTEMDVPGEKYIKSSINYDLDTRNKHIGILEDGRFSWMETIDVLEGI